MAPTTTMLRATRPVIQQWSRGAFRSQFTNTYGRRFQSSTAGDASSAAKQSSWFKRMWDSPVGIKTVHFWAPVMKWALVIAGIGDFARPAENLSLTQNGALTTTGIIWTRWCFVITPKNYLLAAVNFFLSCVGIAQVTRIMMYRSSLKKEELTSGEEVSKAVSS